MKLRPLRPDDAETVAMWRWTERHHLRTPFPVGLPVNDERNMWWMAEDPSIRIGNPIDGSEHVRSPRRSIIGLTNIDWPARSAEVSIVPSNKEALDTLIDLAFRDIGLHRLEANVIAADPIRDQCFLERGFTREGIRKHAAFRSGRWCDVTILGLVND